MVATYKSAAAFIQKIRKAKRDLVFTNVSFVGSEALAEELREMDCADGVIVTQVVPNVYSGATAVARYREALKKYYPNESPSFASLEGYMAAALFAEGLKRAGPGATSEQVIDALETIRGLDLGLGSTLSFSASEHQASHTVWGTVLDQKGQFHELELK
jgi:ABC-type branched-subunit amino acid transport system substrate-binding protein